MQFKGNATCLGGGMVELLMHQFVRGLVILGAEPPARVGRRRNDLMLGMRTCSNPFATTRSEWPGATPVDEDPPPRRVPPTAWRRSADASRPDIGKAVLSLLMPRVRHQATR